MIEIKIPNKRELHTLFLFTNANLQFSLPNVLLGLMLRHIILDVNKTLYDKCYRSVAQKFRLRFKPHQAIALYTVWIEGTKNTIPDFTSYEYIVQNRIMNEIHQQITSLAKVPQPSQF